MPADFFELRADLLIKVEMFLRAIEVLLEMVIAQLIAILILPIFLAVDLDGVIGEMDELVVRFSELELIATGADVALVVPISSRFAVLNKRRGYQTH